MVSCWSVDGKNKPTSTFTNNVQHGSTITVLKWNPAGKRLVTGDKVWQRLYCISMVSQEVIFTAHPQFAMSFQCPIVCI